MTSRLSLITQYGLTFYPNEMPGVSINAALNLRNTMTDKYLKLMVKAQECTTRKKAKKILKKVSKLTPTQLPTSNENPIDS